MTTFIIALLIAVVAALAFTVRHQLMDKRYMGECRMQQAQEIQQLRDRLRTIAEVVDRRCGGVDKRIREHQEIVTAITIRQPALFEDEPGLKHWLSANDEFFKALKSAGYVEPV